MEKEKKIRIDREKMNAISVVLECVENFYYYQEAQDMSDEQKEIMLAVVSKKFNAPFKKLQKKDLVAEGVKTLADFCGNEECNKYLEKYIKPKYIRDVPRIDMIMLDDVMMVFENIDDFVEFPLIRPCVELWSKGYTTYSSSANFMDLLPERKQNGKYYAKIAILDDISQDLAKTLNIRKNEIGTFELFEEIDINSKTDEVSNAFCNTIKSLPKLEKVTTNKLTDFASLDKLYHLKGVDLSKFESLEDALVFKKEKMENENAPKF